MTEPREIAADVHEVVDGLYYWQIHNSNIGGAISSSHAIVMGDDCVFIDPVRLSAEAFGRLPKPSAVVLNARTHQRAAWRYRRECGAEVWLPEDTSPADEAPDRRYAAGDLLPGGLVAVRTPGPEWPHYSLLHQGDPGILICSDLVSHEGGGELLFIPPEFHDDPVETRQSVRRLLDLRFDVLCFDHGPPIVRDPKRSLRRLLEATA